MQCDIHLKIERQNILLKIEYFFLHSTHINDIKLVKKLDKPYVNYKNKSMIRNISTKQRVADLV